MTTMSPADKVTKLMEEALRQGKYDIARGAMLAMTTAFYSEATEEDLIGVIDKLITIQLNEVKEHATAVKELYAIAGLSPELVYKGIQNAKAKYNAGTTD